MCDFFIAKKGGIKMKITEMLLTPNKYSRPQIPLKKVTNIVIHWVGNAGSTAKANRNYFENLRSNEKNYAIGLSGEIIRCIPETEVAYHANNANSYSIGIENCHPDWSGKFNEMTYESLIELCAMLCEKYGLDPMKALIRHYDVTKKLCPKYYVEHTAAWQKLKQDVKVKMASEKPTTDVDVILQEAVKGIVAFGVKLDVNVWSHMETMNMKYARTMVERIGTKFGMKSYEETIEFLVKNECINTREIWDNQQFKPQWCKALLIKVYEKLVKVR